MNALKDSRRLIVWACALSLLCLPAILQGDVLYLKDGSEIRGKVLTFDGDTLVFEPKFGGRIAIHRDSIVSIAFDEDKATKPSTTEAGGVVDTGPGSVSIVFKDDKVTSKVRITTSSKKRDAEIRRANWIEQLLIVGSDTVYARVDTTIDKTIYKGHEKYYKNTIYLEDMSANLAPGVHQCVVVIRNLGAESQKDDFEEGPIDMRLTFESMGIYSNQTTSRKVGMKKGFLRSGTPRLYKAD